MRDVSYSCRWTTLYDADDHFAFLGTCFSLSAERYISHLVHVYLKEVELVTSDQRVPAEGVGIQDAQIHRRLHKLVSTEASEGGGDDDIINGGGSVVAAAVLAVLAVAVLPVLAVAAAVAVVADHGRGGGGGGTAS